MKGFSLFAPRKNVEGDCDQDQNCIHQSVLFKIPDLIVADLVYPIHPLEI